MIEITCRVRGEIQHRLTLSALPLLWIRTRPGNRSPLLSDWAEFVPAFQAEKIEAPIQLKDYSRKTGGRQKKALRVNQDFQLTFSLLPMKGDATYRFRG